jgi:hypothetical protein
LKIDFHRVEPRHDDVHAILEQWGRWVQVVPKLWGSQPMFRGYQSKARHWDVCPLIQVPINTLQTSETERAVAFLPDKHREAIRWFYAFWWVHPGVIQRGLCVNALGLMELLTQGREMLKNRLHEKLVNH